MSLIRDLLPSVPIVAFLFNQSPVVEPPVSQQTIQQQAPQISQVRSVESSSVRHQINCNVTSLDDVKVTEKQSVFMGQTLCDRTEQRQALESKKQQLELSLQQKPSVTTTPEQLTLPPADFSVEEAAVLAAKAELARLEAEPKIETLHYDTNMAMLVEPERFNAQQQQQQRIADARYQLAQAISDLNQAKMERQRQEFTWMSQQQQQQQSLLVRQQQNEQQWQFQKSMILNSIQEIDEKLEQVTAVKSPYSGKVRRVKVISQNERNINVEISLISE